MITAVQLTSAAKNAITNAIVTHFASSSVGNAAGGGLLSGIAAYFKTSAATASLGQIGIAIAAGLGLGELIGKQVNTGLASLAESIGDSELASYYREYDTPFKAIKGLVETIKEGHTSIGEQVAEQISNIKIMEQKISELPPQVQKVWRSVAMGEKPLKSIGKTGSSSFGALSEAIEKASWKMTEKFSGFLKLIPGYVEQTGKDVDGKTKNGLANVGASVANGKNQITSLVKQTKNSVVSDYNNMNNSASNSVKNMSQNTTSSVQGMAGSVVTSIQGMAGNSTTNFSVMTKNATSSANGMSLSVLNALTWMKNSSGTTLGGMASDMAQKFAKMQVDSSSGGKNVTNAFVGALSGLRCGANNQWGGVESDTSKHTKNTSGIIQRENWNPIGANLVNGLRIGLTNKWNSRGPAGLVGGIVSLARGLTSALKRAFGIHSPSKLWNKEIGQFLPPGIGLGMESAMPKLLNDASGMATDLTSAFNTSLKFTDPLQDLADMSADIASSINTDVATSTSTVIDTGRMSTDIASGIVDGMSMSQADQNRLLREQNELLRQLLAKDTGISSNDIFESVKRSNRQAFNRTGKNPLVY